MKKIKLSKVLHPNSDRMHDLCDIVIDIAYPNNNGGAKILLRDKCKALLAKYMIKLLNGSPPIYIGIMPHDDLDPAKDPNKLLPLINIIDLAEVN